MLEAFVQMVKSVKDILVKWRKIQMLYVYKSHG